MAILNWLMGDGQPEALDLSAGRSRPLFFFAISLSQSLIGLVPSRFPL